MSQLFVIFIRLFPSFCLAKVKETSVVFGYLTVVLRLNEIGNSFKQRQSILIWQRDVIRIGVEKLDVLLR